MCLFGEVASHLAASFTRRVTIPASVRGDDSMVEVRVEAGNTNLEYGPLGLWSWCVCGSSRAWVWQQPLVTAARCILEAKAHEWSEPGPEGCITWRS